jgi:hypothetical protein
MVNLMVIWTPVLVSVGIFLNFLTIMVFNRARIRKSFLSIVMISLSIADISVLINVFLTWLDERYFYYYFFDNTLCKLISNLLRSPANLKSKIKEIMIYFWGIKALITSEFEI